MASMPYNWLGNSGLKISSICLGTMTFGEHPQGRPGCNEEESHKILDRFVELGGNFIDTADLYINGVSETIIGNWLKKQTTLKRENVILATKGGKCQFDPKDPNCFGSSRHNIIARVNDSLKRLQTDYIDLYYIHCWDDGTPVEEMLSALNFLVNQGKIHYLAMSNTKGWQLQKIIEVTKQNNYAPILALQQQYSLLCRSTEWEVVEVCRNEGLGLLPWSPLKGGWLTGKITREGAPEDCRVGWASGRAHHSHPDFAWFKDNNQVFDVLDKCKEIADKKGRTVPQVAQRWLLQQKVVPSIVIGVRSLAQLEDSMGTVSFELTDQEMKELTEISAIPAPYPYDYIPMGNVGRQKP